MGTKRPWKLLFLALALLVSLALASCRTAPRRPFSTRTPAPPTPTPLGQTRPKTTPAPTTPMGPLPTDTKAVADLQDKLAKEAEQVQGVNKAWVVVSGKTALVGTELKENFTGGSQGDATGIKDDIMTRLRKADTRITGVVVATDAGTVKQVRKVAEGMRAGKPATTFTRDVDSLVSRLSPGTR
ncbi:MAG TPA: YhcN/YlaJ family sporulation lipoprotein [bacterium]|jgi:YhcN/YlaJ family sporulation lipoprotein|nr:YhcN/YlaJ family sporulation lipoprotein [bacterium]